MGWTVPPHPSFTTNGFKEEMGVFWHLLLKIKEHFTAGCPSCANPPYGTLECFYRDTITYDIYNDIYALVV